MMTAHTAASHSHQPTQREPHGQADSPMLRMQQTMLAWVAKLGPAERVAQNGMLLALRLIYGWFFATTGWGKLNNLEGVTGFFESLGLPAPGMMAALTATTELVGGVLLLVGFGTRITSAVLAFVMLVALGTAHADEAFAGLEAFTEQAPYPFLLATLLLIAFGPGRIALDRFMHAKARACRVAWGTPGD